MKTCLKMLGITGALLLTSSKEGHPIIKLSREKMVFEETEQK